MKRFIENNRKVYEEFHLFKVYKNKIYWYILIIIAVLYSGGILILDNYGGQEEILEMNFFNIVFTVVGAVSVLVLLIRIIFYTILDLIYSDLKGKIFLIILLLLFTIRACGEMARLQ